MEKNFITVEAILNERISSLEIAKVVNKSHKNVMQAIRNMEPAWVKVNGLKFQLVNYMDAKGEKRPCYSLTRLETLFIATKFNDEARARLVIYCDQLEQREKARMQKELIEQEENLTYLNEVLKSEDTLTTTMIAKEFDLSARQANKILHNEGVIFKQSGQWFLYAPLHGKNLVDYETLPDTENGHYRTHRQMRWTEEGHRFVSQLIGNHLMKKALMAKPRYVEGIIAFVF